MAQNHPKIINSGQILQLKGNFFFENTQENGKLTLICIKRLKPTKKGKKKFSR